MSASIFVTFRYFLRELTDISLNSILFLQPYILFLSSSKTLSKGIFFDTKYTMR